MAEMSLIVLEIEFGGYAANIMSRIIRKDINNP